MLKKFNKYRDNYRNFRMGNYKGAQGEISDIVINITNKYCNNFSIKELEIIKIQNKYDKMKFAILDPIDKNMLYTCRL